MISLNEQTAICYSFNMHLLSTWHIENMETLRSENLKQFPFFP